MRILLLLFFIFVGPRSWGFQYQIEAKSLLHPSLLKAQQLSRTFESEGLWSVRSASFVQVGMPFDFVYVNQDWDKAILVKEGLVAPAEKMGVILRDEKLGASIFHFQIEGSSYVLMALGFSSAELNHILAPFKPRLSASKWSLLMNSAYAADADCNPKTTAQQTLAESSAGLEDGAILRMIGKCGMDALQGVKQSAEGTMNFFKKLVSDPGALWTDMKNSFSELKEFALNMKSEVISMIDTLGNMPAEQKLQIACTMTGEVLGGAIQAAILAGTLTKIIPMAIAKLRKAGSLLAKLGDLKKQGFKTPDLNLATKEILSCAY
ncbi:MAG: hypothetical protein JSU04_05080 [Bdellovibrionales bacterium]|nr:hypothetical protein [Bdellovibrionales bacterium]